MTNVKGTPVLIKACSNVLTIYGAPAGTPITIYDISGKLIATNTAAEIETRVAVGGGEEVVVVKVGNKVVKVKR